MYIYAYAVVIRHSYDKKEGASSKHIVFARRIVKHGTVSGEFFWPGVGRLSDVIEWCVVPD
jgi:hypothetical protein